MTNTAWPRVVAWLACLVLSCAACGASTDRADATSPDVAVEVVAEAALPETSPELVGDGRLSFHDEYGDDQRSCVDATTCIYHVTFNSERTLRVRYQIGGVPAPGREIAFEVVEDPKGMGRVEEPRVRTDPEGVATALVRVVEPVESVFKVRVWVPERPEVSPLFFVVGPI